MYLDVIFSYFTPGNADTEGWKGSGIRCDRRTITVPFGGPAPKDIQGAAGLAQHAYGYVVMGQSLGGRGKAEGAGDYWGCHGR